MMPEDDSPVNEEILARKQMADLEKLRAMRVPASEGLALLDLVPDVAPEPEDAIVSARRK